LRYPCRDLFRRSRTNSCVFCKVFCDTILCPYRRFNGVN